MSWSAVTHFLTGLWTAFFRRGSVRSNPTPTFSRPPCASPPPLAYPLCSSTMCSTTSTQPALTVGRASASSLRSRCVRRCSLLLGQAMRLTTAQAETIRRHVAVLAGDAARVWLFGSRVHDDARGGDVDPVAELDDVVARPSLDGRLACSPGVAHHAWPQGGCVDQSPQFATLAHSHHCTGRGHTFMKITPAQVARLQFLVCDRQRVSAFAGYRPPSVWPTSLPWRLPETLRPIRYWQSG